MHTGFALSFGLKVMISSCKHFYDNLSFTGILKRLIFDRVYGSWMILSLQLFTINNIHSYVTQPALLKTGQQSSQIVKHNKERDRRLRSHPANVLNHLSLNIVKQTNKALQNHAHL